MKPNGNAKHATKKEKPKTRLILKQSRKPKNSLVAYLFGQAKELIKTETNLYQLKKKLQRAAKAYCADGTVTHRGMIKNLQLPIIIDATSTPFGRSLLCVADTGNFFWRVSEEEVIKCKCGGKFHYIDREGWVCDSCDLTSIFKPRQ